MKEKAENFKILVNKHSINDPSLSEYDDTTEHYNEVFENKEGFNKNIRKIKKEINIAKNAYIKELKNIDNENARKLRAEIEKILPKIFKFVKIKLKCYKDTLFSKNDKTPNEKILVNEYDSMLKEMETEKKKLFDLIDRVEL